ncbi:MULTISPECIES: hypothetical protein [Flavobacterium]|uniref:hypothetical protein n=1 Tax=Flavobacterium TaxID=237 RepID=UPI0028077293|nr:hypothetical protein [Flavobacterium lindanitolerans]MDQ7960392.1 hypothetical protein [Flavobacterium lindanitolerans]
MNWKEAKYKGENIYDLPGNWLKIEYFEALNILFRIENSLRVFVYIILKDNFKDKWKDLSVTSDDSETSTIGAIAKKRIAQDKNYAYLGYSLISPLLHLTSGELIRIITSDSYWKYFKNYFPGSREIIKNKLDEIGNVRNSLAHFRPVKKGDIQLVKQNSIHTLSQIEKTLIDFINCSDIVPTNTEETWYKELITLGINECNLSFKQSKSEEWIKLQMSFTPPLFRKSNEWPGYRVKTLNLKSDKLLLDYNNLSKYCIALSETAPSGYINDAENHIIEKKINFTFGRKTMEEHYQEIKQDLEEILLRVTQETALIKEDNLARGKLVEVANCAYHYRKSESEEYYELVANQLITELTDLTPVEFWGSLSYSYIGFITSTEKYPWMPVDISEDKDFTF